MDECVGADPNRLLGPTVSGISSAHVFPPTTTATGHVEFGMLVGGLLVKAQCIPLQQENKKTKDELHFRLLPGPE
jgi:hypothetical protein